MMPSPNRSLLAALVAAALVACSGDSFTPSADDGPTEKSESLLSVIAVAPTALPEATVVSFYAVKGQGREQRLYTVKSDGSRGDEYLRFTVGGNTLLARPDGTPFANRDSVLITISVLDRTRMMYQFEPSGLKFNPGSPAELRISYAGAEGDLDNDGDHDSADDSLETRLAIWRQETPGTPFQRLSSLISTSDHDVRANLTGFSRYAVSY
jgi:hypothetical protein